MFYKILARIRNLTKREKILIVTLLILLLVLTIIHVILPQINSYRILQKQVLSNAQKIILLDKQISSLSNEEEYLKKLTVKWENYEKYFPNKMDEGISLEIIGGLLNASDLQLLSFKPQDLVDKKYFKELPVDCVIKGDFEKLIFFIDRLENHNNLIQIKNMVIINSVNSDNDSIEGAEAQISLFLYKNGENVLMKKFN